MTKNNQSTEAGRAALKAWIVFDTDASEYEQHRILGDMCYSLQSSFTFTIGKTSDYVSELRSIVKDGLVDNGGPTSQMQRLTGLIERNEDQEQRLSARLAIATDLHREMTGKEWVPPAKRSNERVVSAVNHILDRYDTTTKGEVVKMVVAK